ncbi:MAG TPA: hypothetical protein EYN38_11195 [Flavobacteriales bacterium]|nr:hypothetical protein [Flavobacteriales bacterium]
MQIEVGTVIYIIDSKEKIVLPARINEQIVSRTMDGETTTHKIEFPNKKTAVLEKLEVSYFLHLDEVRKHLMTRAEQMIDTGINQAQQLATDAFTATSSSNSSDAVLVQGESAQVMLPNGQLANINVKIPEEFLNENSDS